jgi:hypothetical protein
MLRREPKGRFFDCQENRKRYIMDGTMKALIVILCILGLLVTAVSPVAAIDKSKKADPPAVEKKKPDQEKKDTTPTRQKKNPPTYDNFIDKNNNGIDDRAEKSKSPKKEPQPTEKPTKKNPKP